MEMAFSRLCGITLAGPRQRLVGCARWFLISVMAWSAGGKLFWPREFRGVLRASGLFADEMVVVIAYALPWLELGLAVALTVPYCVRIAAAVVSVLSTTFVGIHTYLVWSGTVVACGCAGLKITYASRETHILLAILSALLTLASFHLLFFRVRASRSRKPTDDDDGIGQNSSRVAGFPA